MPDVARERGISSRGAQQYGVPEVLQLSHLGRYGASQTTYSGYAWELSYTCTAGSIEQGSMLRSALPDAHCATHSSAAHGMAWHVTLGSKCRKGNKKAVRCTA